MSSTSLRVMAINLENLFSPGEMFYGSEYTQAEFEAKIEWIGAMIARGQVHVVGMTELGEKPKKCIDEIMSTANRLDTTGGPPFQHEFRAAPGSSGTKIRTAVISRFPLSSTESIASYPDGFCVDLLRPGAQASNTANWIPVPSTKFSRPIAKVRVTPPGGGTAFNLFVVHLKSKRPRTAKHDGDNEAIGIARSAIQRNVEAAALRTYFDSFLPKEYEANNRVATLVVGDFNDTPSSVPLENIRGPFDRVPGPASPWSAPDKRRLLNCARLHLKMAAYEDKLYSYVHNESFTLLDMAFASEHLARRFTRMEVHNDHVFRHKDLSSSTDQAQQWKSRVSDHGVIVVEFTRMLSA